MVFIQFLFFQSTESVVLLRDGNATLYPLARDCLGCIREPPFLDLPPLRCAVSHTVPLPQSATSHNTKSQVCEDV